MQLPEEIKKLEADDRGRVYLGPEYSDATVRIAIVERVDQERGEE